MIANIYAHRHAYNLWGKTVAHVKCRVCGVWSFVLHLACVWSVVEKAQGFCKKASRV